MENPSFNTIGSRRGSRAHCIREITVSSEGHDELIRIKAPDLSSTGMFINAARPFAEGTVLNLKFRLAVTGVEVETRCEVRYSNPGVGIGVEFIGLSPQARKDIEHELALSSETTPRAKKSRRRARRSRRRVPQL
jgi:hypothetical protein